MFLREYPQYLITHGFGGIGRKHARICHILTSVSIGLSSGKIDQQHCMLNQNDAKQRIIDKWHSWITKVNTVNPNGTDALSFFTFLQKEHPGLLDFRATGDKWQTVHSWLIQARLVRD
jgi:hypothetical protein